MESFGDFSRAQYLKDNAFNLHNISVREIERNVPNLNSMDIDSYTTRRAFIKHFSWTIPNKETFDLIRAHIPKPGPIYDLMAGTGYWAKLLALDGYKVAAYDLDISSKHNTYKHASKHFNIKRGNAISVALRLKTAGNPVNIMLGWVPYESEAGNLVVQNLPSQSKVILTGEGRGGATGTSSLFDTLYNQYTSLGSHTPPQWFGLHDFVEIFEKN